MKSVSIVLLCTFLSPVYSTGKKHLVSQSEKPEKDSSHLDINTNIYKSLVLIYDNENKELGFGVTTFKSTVRVHIDVVKNCNGNPTVKFLCNNAKVTTIHYTQTGDIVILTLPNAAYELIVKDMPKIDLKVFKKKDLTGNDIGHLIGRAESGVITIHAVLITNVDDRGIIQTVKMNNNPNENIGDFLFVGDKLLGILIKKQNGLENAVYQDVNHI